MSCNHSNTYHISPSSTKCIRRPLPLHANPTLIPKSKLGSSNPTADASHFRAFFPIISESYNSDSDAPSSTAATCPIGPSPSGRAFDTFIVKRPIRPLASADSSLATCAPYSVVAAASTSATCPSTNAGSDSSWETRESHSAVVATSTSATGPSAGASFGMDRMQRVRRNEVEDERRGGRTKESRLKYHFDDDGDRNRWRKGTRGHTRWTGFSGSIRGKTSFNLKWPWIRFPFQRAKRATNLDEASRSNHVEVRSSERFIPSPSTRRDLPVDLDQVSVGSLYATSRCRKYDNNVNCQSQPTDANPQNKKATADIRGGVPMASRKSRQYGRDLSQMGMDICEEEYCIEGSYSSPRPPSREYPPPIASGNDVHGDQC